LRHRHAGYAGAARRGRRRGCRPARARWRTGHAELLADQNVCSVHFDGVGKYNVNFSQLISANWGHILPISLYHLTPKRKDEQ